MSEVRMWEAVVLPGELEAARAFCLGVVASARATAGCEAARAYDADGDEARVVVITEWATGAEEWQDPEPDRPLFRRAHGWWFRSMAG